MQVASLELSKTLFELSGWDDTPFYHDSSEGWDEQHVEYKGRSSLPVDGGIYPAYDLGYLLRKLPRGMRLNNGIKWNCTHKVAAGKNITTYADTPEDAACKLAIELFKQGVLKS